MTQASHSSSDAPAAGRTRLLIVDDEPDVRAAMMRVLDRSGFAVRVASGVESALTALRAEPVELVITDMIMPQQNGVVLIEAVKAEFPTVKVVAFSGGGNFWPQGYKPEAITTSAYLAAAEKSGADGVLAKPFELAELLAVIQSVLGKGARPA